VGVVGVRGFGGEVGGDGLGGGCFEVSTIMKWSQFWRTSIEYDERGNNFVPSRDRSGVEC